MTVQTETNIAIICQYLGIHASPTRGAAVEQIIDATGLSKSTVYRIIKQHPAIKRVENRSGPKSRYFLDLEAVSNGSAALPSRVMEDDRLSLRYVSKSLRREIIDGITEYGNEAYKQALNNFQSGEFVNMLDDVLNVISEAENYQKGTGSMTLKGIDSARGSIDRLIRGSAMLALLVEQIKAHPNYMDNENFWQIFPVTE